MVDLNDITYDIRRAIFEVHNVLGPGPLESVYEAALAHELIESELLVQTQVPLVKYKNTYLDLGFRVDMLVEDSIIVEVKSIESLANIHKKQLLNYLRLAKKKIGLLVNFNVEKLIDKESLVRIIN